MTPAAKIVYFLMLVMCLSIGARSGFKAALENLRNYDDLKALTGPHALEEFSYEQYRYADSEHGKAALQTYANLLEEMEMLRPDKTHEIALWTTYARMALLEDAGNDPAQSERSMTKARSWYLATGGQDRSETELKVVVKKSDERIHELLETPSGSGMTK